MQDNQNTNPEISQEGTATNSEINANNDLHFEISEDDSYPSEEAQETKIEQEAEKALNEPESPDYARLAEEDLAEIKRLFPQLSTVSDLRELDNASRFGELRESGLSVKEAFLATNYNRLLDSFAKRAARTDTKSHLRSAVPTASVPSRISMSAEELHSAREMFSNLSDREIEQLYKRAMS